MSAELFGEDEEAVMPESSSRQPSKKAAGPAADTAPEPAAAPRQPESGPRFEEAYNRLTELVAEMERGELPLEELLKRFEEGVRLVRHCQGFLKEAQLKVEQYVELKDGQWVLKDLPDANPR